MSTTSHVTGILGAGVMGETLLSGLIRAGRPVAELLVGEKRAERARELEERYGVAVVSQPRGRQARRHPRPGGQAAGHGRPAGGDRPARSAPGQLVVSLAAGITTVVHRVAPARRHARRPRHAQHPGAGRRGHGRDRGRLPLRRGAPREAEELLGSTGRVMRVPEKQMDAVTAISGSGPAYIFFVVEAMIEAGVHLGLPRATVDRAGRPDRRRLRQDAARDRRPPGRAARAGHLAGRHHRRRAARAGDPQGAGGVPGCDGGRGQAVVGAGRGLLSPALTAPSRRWRRRAPRR